MTAAYFSASTVRSITNRPSALSPAHHLGASHHASTSGPAQRSRAMISADFRFHAVLLSLLPEKIPLPASPPGALAPPPARGERAIDRRRDFSILQDFFSELRYWPSAGFADFRISFDFIRSGEIFRGFRLMHHFKRDALTTMLSSRMLYGLTLSRIADGECFIHRFISEKPAFRYFIAIRRAAFARADIIFRALFLLAIVSLIASDFSNIISFSHVFLSLMSRSFWPPEPSHFY